MIFKDFHDMKFGTHSELCFSTLQLRYPSLQQNCRHFFLEGGSNFNQCFHLLQRPRRPQRDLDAHVPRQRQQVAFLLRTGVVMQQVMEVAPPHKLKHQQPLFVLHTVPHELHGVGMLQPRQALHHPQTLHFVLHQGTIEPVDLLHRQHLAVGELRPVHAT